MPVGFIPEQDKGYLVLNAQLPDGAALDRTDKVVREMSKIAREVPGVAHTIDLPGYSAVLGHEHQQRRRHVRDPRSVRGASRQGGARRTGDHGAAAREVQHDHRGACRRVRCAAGRGPGNHRRFQAASAGSPQCRSAFACKVRSKTSPTRETAIRGWPACSPASASRSRSYTSTSTKKRPRRKESSFKDIDATLQAYLGSFYVNDFFFQNRNWQVNLQAAPRYRMKIEDIGNLEVRNGKGQRVPLRTLINVRYDSGPAIVNHYNLYPSAEINGSTAPGVSSGQAIDIMDGLADDRAARTRWDSSGRS